MTATQAPTPGPLSAQQEEAIAFNLCSLHGFDPAFVNTQRDFAFAVIKEYERVRPSLAPTAPVEASGSERERLISVMRDHIELGEIGSCSAEIVGHEEAADAILALRPQPSGETREAVARLTAGLESAHPNHKTMFVYVDDLRQALALLSASPLALGGQQGEAKRVRHKKRGTEYTIIGVGRAQGEISDEDPVVLYRGDTDGSLWVRHQAEFSDGRFEYVTTPARAEAQDEGAAGEVVTALREAAGFYEAAGLPITAERLRGLAERHSAHPSPTPAADAERVRIAGEALEPFAHIASHVGLPKDDTVHVTALDGQWIATVRREDFWNARQALAALKSEGN